MPEDKSQNIEKLYDLSLKSANVPSPKRVLLGFKCPKCGSKLDRESEKEMIFVGEAGTEFANKVGKNANLAVGAYSLRIDYFKCKCGYEYAKAKTDLFEDVG